MLQILMPLARRYAVYLTFPAALIIGTIGYSIERILTKDRPAQVSRKAIKEERDVRLLEASRDGASEVRDDRLEAPKKPRLPSIFEKNVQLESRFTS